jgi:hypothetical protein
LGGSLFPRHPRTHDGRYYVHGAGAVKKLETLPHLNELFGNGGVAPAD